MTTAYQKRVQERDEEKKIKGGVMNIAGRLNYEKQFYQNKTQGLFNIITKYGNEEALREAYKLVGQSVLVKYEAIVGTKTRKNGEEYECWNTVWDKYAGKMTADKKPPLCNGYVTYVNDEDFDFNKETNTFIYKGDTVSINNVEVRLSKIA
jgi:molybdopterin converting factor small subunit